MTNQTPQADYAAVTSQWRDELQALIRKQGDPRRSFDRWHLPHIEGMRPHELVPADVQHILVRSLVETIALLREQCSDVLGASQLVAIATLPDMWDNQICAFHSDDYYRTFADRSGPGQTWTPLHGTSLCGRLGIDLPAALRERGYHTLEVNSHYLVDGAPHRKEGELWMIGEL